MSWKCICPFQKMSTSSAVIHVPNSTIEILLLNNSWIHKILLLTYLHFRHIVCYSIYICSINENISTTKPFVRIRATRSGCLFYEWINMAELISWIDWMVHWFIMRSLVATYWWNDATTERMSEKIHWHTVVLHYIILILYYLPSNYALELIFFKH